MLGKETIFKNLGIESLTQMQLQMESCTRQEGGVVLLSPTGSGKTLAYLLPLIREINAEIAALQAVVVVPTRELAQQSEDVMKRMKTGLRSLSLYGGRPAMEEHRKIKEVKPQVVFATPGRLNDHLSKGNLDSLLVRVVVIDEFDKCLELGFQEEMNQLLLQFRRANRCWLTSATDAEEIPDFMSLLKMKFEKLNFLKQAEELRERISMKCVLSSEKDKLPALGRLLTLVGDAPTIVFVSYRESVDRVWKWLVSEGFSAVAYHGGMEQEFRERALYRFRSGSANVLVSTDLAARGLDIPEVSLVAILDADKEGFLRSERSLIQTIGRAARNTDGKVIMYADELTDSMDKAITETNRRRKIQMAYNEEHGIVPQTIKKSVRDTIRASIVAEASEKYELSSDTSVEDIINKLTEEMLAHAEKMEFEEAAKLRDQIKELEAMIK